uniref:GID complex subunit 4 homolog n=1 Tax=Cyprinodon variegatus TaxID=28743 RepID=A0A3Q2DN49_CYPVA
MPVRAECCCPTGAACPSSACLVPPAPINTHQPGVFTSLLCSGAQYRGYQRSKGNSYDVEVVLQHVTMEDSYLCGYLKIKGLTEEFPTLTTFFVGEIISWRRPFLTRKWDADEDVDRKHWGKFPAFYKYGKSFNSDNFDYRALENSDYIFMRWKVSRFLLFFFFSSLFSNYAASVVVGLSGAVSCSRPHNQRHQRCLLRRLLLHLLPEVHSHH